MARLPELALLLESRLSSELSEKRASHSRGVADFAARLCELHGLDPERGRVAGLAHDLCKEMPLEEQRRLCGEWLSDPGIAAGWPSMDEGAGFRDQVLHGPAAARLLARDYGFSDADISEAVAWHTVGKADMGPLALVVYCADKIEPGRKHVDEAFRARCLSMKPEAMLLSVVEDTIGYLGRKGWEIAPGTLILYNALRNLEMEP